jgi:hypothetical protein
MIDDKKSTDPGLSAAERKTLRGREAEEAIRWRSWPRQGGCFHGRSNMSTSRTCQAPTGGFRARQGRPAPNDGSPARWRLKEDAN